MPITVSFETDLSTEDIAPLWQDLAKRAKSSFFLSWHWVGCWLRESGLKPMLLAARRGDEPIGLALLHRPAVRRPWQLPALHLTSAAGSDLDSIFIEYNGFLAAAEDQAAVENAFLEFLLDLPALGGDGWTRLILPGVGEATRTRLAEAGLTVHPIACKPSPYVDLATIRRAGSDYLATRSHNCRHQIRRSIRLFGTAGEPRVEPAASLDDALAALDQLKLLHQSRWRERNQPGAFATPFFERFHRRLIVEAWASGVIDLARLRVGDEIVGCLYNFVQNGVAYAYQSGFDFRRDDRHKPGLVLHALTAQRYLEAGLDRYLLLAGDSRYKTSLATGSETLHWVVARRPGLVATVGQAVDMVERLARGLARRIPLANPHALDSFAPKSRRLQTIDFAQKTKPP